MKIKWLGTASLLIETNKYKILFDPYLRLFNKKLPSFPLDEIKNVDAIFISHPHFDHFADIPTIMKYTNCPIYTNSRGIEIAKNLKFDDKRFNVMAPGNVFEFGKTTINIYQGKHIIFDRKNVRYAFRRAFRFRLIKSLRIGKYNKNFKIKLKDICCFSVLEGKKSIFIMGSANIDDETVYPNSISLLVYPYQGRSDMLEYSASIIKQLKPEQVMLDHYDDAFPPISTRMNVEAFKEKIEKENGISVIIPTENEWIDV